MRHGRDGGSRVGDAREGGSGVAQALEVVEAQDAAHGDGHEGGIEELQGRIDVADQPATLTKCHQNVNTI